MSQILLRLKESAIGALLSTMNDTFSVFILETKSGVGLAPVSGPATRACVELNRNLGFSKPVTRVYSLPAAKSRQQVMFNVTIMGDFGFIRSCQGRQELGVGFAEQSIPAKEANEIW
jgi:hypothetical protein